MAYSLPRISVTSTILSIPSTAVFVVDASLLPLPHFGLGINHLFTPRLIGHATVKGFALEIGDTYGQLIEASVGVQYQLANNFGIGGGIKWFFLDVVEDETERVDDKYGIRFFRTRHIYDVYVLVYKEGDL